MSATLAPPTVALPPPPVPAARLVVLPATRDAPADFGGNWGPKDPGDTLWFGLDLGEFLAAAGTTVGPGVGAAASPAGLAVGPPALDPTGTQVLVQLSGGLAGVLYAVGFTVPLASGEVLTRTCYVPVQPLSTYRSGGQVVAAGPPGAKGDRGPAGPVASVVPSASLLGGTGSGLVGVALGAALTLVGGVLGVSDLSTVPATPAAPGTVARPLSDRLRDRLTVRDFGAKTDGATDDRAAFLAAMATGAARVPAGASFLSAPAVNTAAVVLMDPGASITGPGYLYPGRHEYFQGQRKVTTARAGYATNSQVIGNTLNVENSGWSAVGDSFNYVANFPANVPSSGGDLARQEIARWKTNTTAAVNVPGLMLHWFVGAGPGAIDSPNSNFGLCLAEWNPIHLHTDHGFTPDLRSINHWTGGMWVVPDQGGMFTQTPPGGGSATTGGGTNISFSYAVAFNGVGFGSAGYLPGGGPNNGRSYAGLLGMPDSIARGGFLVFGTGAPAQDAANNPASPLGVAGWWNTGLDLTRASFGDGIGLKLAGGTRVAFDASAAHTLWLSSGLRYSVQGNGDVLVVEDAGVLHVGRYQGNGLRLASAAAGSGVSIAAEGADANVGLALLPKGTGVVTVPTPATADNSQAVATTAYVQAQGFAPLASPAFTGNPTVGPANGNLLRLAGAAAGGSVAIWAQGADTDVAFEVHTKGAGNLNVFNGAQSILTVFSGGMTGAGAYPQLSNRNGGAGYGSSSGPAVLGGPAGAQVGAYGSDKVGFYGTTPAARPTVSGAKAANAALASLVSALAALGLLLDTTTA